MTKFSDDHTPSRSGPDVQSRSPATRISLSRVGVTGVEKIVRISVNGDEQFYHASLECFVDLNPNQAGVHMSRFEEIFNEAIEAVVLGEAFKAETLAAHIAERVRERQRGLRAEVTMRARYPEYKQTPVSGSTSQELYTLIGAAVASDRGLRQLVGVQAQGMTACPCAQELVTESARKRLEGHGFTDDEIERVFESVPVATHNQRGIGTLYVGCPEGCAMEVGAEMLLGIVESSMSSEIYELMKRSDELAVVEKAHRRPRFVEDCVREMLRGALAAFPSLAEEAFMHARQENLETIHQHNVVAERYGLVGELRAEIDSGEHSQRHVTMREWLESPAAP
jgi:GTP cyclohydrolase IV